MVALWIRRGLGQVGRAYERWWRQVACGLGFALSVTAGALLFYDYPFPPSPFAPWHAAHRARNTCSPAGFPATCTAPAPRMSETNRARPMSGVVDLAGKPSICGILTKK